MPTTWTISINWDRDGGFTEPYDNVTTRVSSAEWKLGFGKPYQDIADDSTLTLILDNTDKRYSPENASSPIAGKVRPFVPVRVQSNDGTTTRTHWLGWIEIIQPDVGQNATPTTGDPRFNGSFYVESYKPSLDKGTAVTFEVTLKPSASVNPTLPAWTTVTP